MDPKNDQIVIDEADIQESDFTSEELNNDTTDWKAKAQELKGIAKRRATQLKKAKEALSNTKPNEPKPDNKKSNEPDYGKLAYLKANDVSHQDDVTYIMDIATNTGETLDKILSKAHIQAELTARRDERKVADATPSNRNRSGDPARDTVDYHLAKQTPVLEISDIKLRREVVHAKMKQDGQKSRFTDNPIAK